MFLTFGLNTSNELIYISEVKSGKSSLLCPYCKQPLIAKKGKIKDHHFSHASQTCADSKDAIHASQLPTFDNFELLTKKEQLYIERRSKYKHKDIFYFSSMGLTVELLEAMGILTVEYEESSPYVDKVERVNAALKKINRSYIVEGKPNRLLQQIFEAIEPMVNFDLSKSWQDTKIAKATSINRIYHNNKLEKQTNLNGLIKSQNFWFDCHYKRIAHQTPAFIPLLEARLKQINTQHLYLFKFESDDPTLKTFVKIGMTTRDPQERLKEVNQLLKTQALINITSSQVLACRHNAGRVERLLHHFYESKRIRFGSFTEFFILSDKEIEELIQGMSDVKFDEYRPPTDVVFTQAPKAAGRKKKTEIELIAEHSEIVECLQKGMGIRETARQTKSGVNTVQRVKKALNN